MLPSPSYVHQPRAARNDRQSRLLGLFLALVFGAANAYLGMKAGQTIAATIPAAVIAIALFRLPAFRGGMLEQNIARTAASVGEALVAGAIFTIPAFMMVEMNGERLWADLRAHYWESVLILLVGGLIGVFFIIVLRRPLCVEADLPFPESVASAEVVKAGRAGQRRAQVRLRRHGFRRPAADPQDRQGPADLPRVHRGLPGIPALGGAPLQLSETAHRRRGPRGRHLLVHARASRPR